MNIGDIAEISMTGVVRYVGVQDIQVEVTKPDGFHETYWLPKSSIKNTVPGINLNKER